MTKEQAMTILELDEGFTYDELNNAYEKLAPKAIEFHAKHVGKNRDILEAYRLLKDNKLYNPTNDSDNFTVLSHRNQKQKLQYIARQIEDAKEYIANIYKCLDVFLKSSDGSFAMDHQISIFDSYPDYLKAYANNLRLKAEKFKNSNSNFKEFSDLTNFINDYDDFNNYVEQCYKEIILEVLKDNDIATWNAEKVFKQIFWQNINITSEDPKKAFYRSYLSVQDFYQKVIEIVNKLAKTFQYNFSTKVNDLFNNWLNHYKRYGYSGHIDYNQVFANATKEIKKELKNYSSYKQMSNKHFEERFYGLLNFYAEESANKNYETDVNAIWNFKMKEYYEESLGSFFIVGGSLIDESKKKVDKKYGLNKKVCGSQKVQEVEDYIDSLLLNIVKKGKKLFYQIKALMDKYPEFGSYVRDKNYLLDDIYQKFNGELLDKLKEIVPNFDERELDLLPLNSKLSKKDYLQISSFDEQLNSSTYLVYKGHVLTWDEINTQMSKYTRKDEQVRMIFEDGIIFTKNVPLQEINNYKIFEPTIYNNNCWTITDIDFEKLKELFPNIRALNTSEFLKELASYGNISSRLSTQNTFYILRCLENNINFSCISYNYATNKLFIIINNAPMYMGYPNEGEIMYSNNASLLREFCPIVYKLPSKSYSLNEECYEKKDGIDLVIRSLKI